MWVIWFFFLILFLKVGSYFFSTLMCPPLQGMNDSSIYIYNRWYIFWLDLFAEWSQTACMWFFFFLNNAKSLQLLNLDRLSVIIFLNLDCLWSSTCQESKKSSSYDAVSVIIKFLLVVINYLSPVNYGYWSFKYSYFYNQFSSSPLFFIFYSFSNRRTLGLVDCNFVNNYR